ncbi:MAG: hypothetical protein HY260_20500 [Chloroflexi bacterium]|nr:hypothetical protein [Chloroflexota bacterium]
MNVTITMTAPTFSETEVGETVAYALQNGAALAKARRDFFRNSCATFEKKHAMTSDEFWAKFEAGELGDDAEYFDWYAVKRGFDLWNRRYLILAGVRV